MMDLPAISTARLISQQVDTAKYKRIQDLVSYMGAIQAQDYAMAKWAIGLRLPGSTERQIEKALDKGVILRTHVLRPTWHFVAAEDIYWMLALTADRIKAAGKTMNRQLELSDRVFTKSNAIIEKSLQGGKHLGREELSASLEKAKISVSGNRLSHLLLRAELEGITCSGKMEGNKRTYALLGERVPAKKKLNKEESLTLLAKKYFSSHGPAAIEDFTWWSGLSGKDAKQALELVKSNLIAEKINERTYWFSNALQLPATSQPSVHLLPAFDEFIISYKDRSASLAAGHHKKVLSVNGIFNPVIVVNGQVKGLWKRTVQKDKIIIETAFFRAYNKATRLLIGKEAEAFGQFAGQPTEVIYHTK